MRIQNRKRSQDDCPPFWPTLSWWTRRLHSERLTSKHWPVRGAWLSAAGDPARGPRRNAAPAAHTASRPGALPPLKAGEVTPNHAVSGRRCLPGRLWDRRASRDRGAGAPVAPRISRSLLPLPPGPGFPHGAAGAVGLSMRGTTTTVSQEPLGCLASLGKERHVHYP